MGVELDPLALTPEQRDELKGWIALHKELRPILHAPDAEWIDLPVVDGRHVFGVTLRDSDLKTEHMIVAVAQATHPKTEQPMPLRLPTYYGTGPFAIREIGPVPAGFARISEAQRALLKGEPAIGSDLLWSHGIPLPHLYPESAILLEIKTVGAKHG
jgi:alpha-galactosidase